MLMHTTAPRTTAPPPPIPGGGPISARTAVQRNEACGRPHSIYLEEVGRLVDDRPQEYRLVMPRDNGSLAESVLRRRTGVVVTWPTNPHDSGEAAILDRLNDREARASFRAPVAHDDFRADQNGRHHRIRS